jgi:hypothetical protein
VRAEIEPWRADHPQAAAVFDGLALAEEFEEFLTLPAYDLLD